MDHILAFRLLSIHVHSRDWNCGDNGVRSDFYDSTFSYFLSFRFSRLPPRSVQLLVSVHSKAKIVTTSVGDVIGDARDLTDDDEVVSLGFFIDSPVKREGVNEVVVDARGLGAVDPVSQYECLALNLCPYQR